jgi:hypothetical protein
MIFLQERTTAQSKGLLLLLERNPDFGEVENGTVTEAT